MKDLYGGPGTVTGLMLRIGQSAFDAASLAVMLSFRFAFSNYKAFKYMTGSMGLQVLWSFGLACLDTYGLIKKKDLKGVTLVTVILLGDWITATLSLGTACSSAGVVIFFGDNGMCKMDDMVPTCRGSPISVGLAFATSTLIAVSFGIMFFMLASA